jgi:opacity protein-like surface antigen
VTRLFRYLPLLILPLFCIQFADAQSSFDVNVGFGAAQAKELGSVDINTLGPCTTAASCSNTAKLSNFMMGVGANLMLWNHFGVGGQINIQPARQDYLAFQQQSAGQNFSDILQTRVSFYDFNGIYQPIATKKASLQLKGGIGAANVKFYEHISGSSPILGNSNQTQFLQSSNHFAVNGGIGAQIYLTNNIFIRPEFTIRYINNFTQQFGHNYATQEMVWLGYSLGRQ